MRSHSVSPPAVQLSLGLRQDPRYVGECSGNLCVHGIIVEQALRAVKSSTGEALDSRHQVP